MTLSTNALTVGYAVRRHEGAAVKGAGPSIEVLMTLPKISDLTHAELRDAILELERGGYFRVSRGFGVKLPIELEGIVKVAINESLQSLFDDMDI